MKGYSRDMFEEMDEIFARLFSQMQQDMLADNRQFSGYRIVIRGSDFPESDGNTPGVQPRITETPVAEMHRIDDEVKVIAELPGARPDSIRLGVDGQRLIIDAGDPEMPYHTMADLPPVDAGSMQHSFRNGVLEVTFRLLPEPAPAA